MLIVKNLTTYYGKIKAINDISLEVGEGEVVALLGSNCAGKSTTLKTIAGLVRPSSGEVILRGEKISGMPADKMVRKGIAYVPEGRGVFYDMTTMENIELGAYIVKDRKETIESMEKVFNYFPILKHRSKQIAGTLSGGEQQMLAIGRVLMSRPKLILLDEPSLGLAPLVTAQVFDTLGQIRTGGLFVLLSDQNVHHAISISNRGYVRTWQYKDRG